MTVPTEGYNSRPDNAGRRKQQTSEKKNEKKRSGRIQSR
jgi:hypothetical protein